MSTRVTPALAWQLDHLVVGAASLDQGVAWARATLGVEPAAGGTHAAMSTHNRLVAIGSPAFARSYLEIIAIDPQAPPPGRARWFDMDQPAVQARLARGPELLHWVARCADVRAACRALAAAGIDRGEVLAAERSSPQGVLRWQISVRADGQRLFEGALPTLIEWGEIHPAESLPESGLRLERLRLGGLPAAVRGWLPKGVEHDASPAAQPLRATFTTPLGVVKLSSS